MSPYTSTQSGFSAAITGSSAVSMRAVCDVFEPSDTPSSRSGGGRPSSEKNTDDSLSSKCCPV